jgi:Zn-dependent M28 family amino/carboxypeptidase
MKRLVLLVIPALTLTAAQLSAQEQPASPAQTISQAAIDGAMATITEADFRAKLGAFAHDSTRGRESPSPELEKATEWVAAQFRSAGLAPGGYAGSYYQPFQMAEAQADSLSAMWASGPGMELEWLFGRDLVYTSNQAPADFGAAPVVVLPGMPADLSDPFGDVSVRGAVVLHVAEFGEIRGSVLNPLVRTAQGEGAVGWVIVTEIAPEIFEQFLQPTFMPRWTLVGAAPDHRGMMVFGVQASAAEELVRLTGQDFTTLAAAAGDGVQTLDGVTISFAPHFTTQRQATVANVVGVLEGSDPTLRDEAVVFTSHMDHVGLITDRCRPSEVLPADSICNGADDNASGTIGIIELAEAFATLEPRPARTLIFAAVTAEERGLFGSRFYVDHPIIPLDKTVAEINLDMIARNPRDTVGFVGKDYSSMGQIVDDLVRDHHELNLTPTEHEGLYPNSDHYPFAQRGVPALFFFSGVHGDLHTAGDNPDRADAEQASRIVRLAFLVGLEVANTMVPPVWDPEARDRIVGPELTP